jgi:hypothetical protein
MNNQKLLQTIYISKPGLEVGGEVGCFRLLNQEPHQVLAAVTGCCLERVAVLSSLGVDLGAPVD